MYVFAFACTVFRWFFGKACLDLRVGPPAERKAEHFLLGSLAGVEYDTISELFSPFTAAAKCITMDNVLSIIGVVSFHILERIIFIASAPICT